MTMTRYVARKLGALMISALVASFIVFGSLYLAPGNPESVLFGATTPSPEARAAVRAQYHLDDPFLARYWHWLTDVVRGDFGISLVGGQPVSGRIEASIGTTLQLIVFAAVLIAIVGVGTGLVMGLYPGRTDTVLSVVVTLACSVPAFVTASLLIAVFAVGLGWFPAYGSPPDGGLGATIRSLVLPAVALALVASALLARITRASVRAEQAKDYVTTARARSLPQGVIVRRHILPNAAPGIITAAGLLVASLFAGTIVVENAFGLDGLGSLLVGSVNRQDFATVQAVTLIMVVAFVLTNTVVDVLTQALDPRLKGRQS